MGGNITVQFEWSSSCSEHALTGRGCVVSKMAQNLCTDIIIHPDFKLTSPLESHFDTTSSEQVESSDQSASDTSILVSKDQTYCVQPLNVATSNHTLQDAFDTLLNKPSFLEPIVNSTTVIHPKTCF